jgi:hypothetical protein
MICSNCGFQNVPGARVCANCNTPLPEPPPPETSVQGASVPPPESAIPPFAPSLGQQPPHQQPPPFQSTPPQQPAPLGAGWLAAGTYPARPLKDRSIALLLEIVGGLFGLFGLGWIYSTRNEVGIPLLIGGLVWGVVALLMITLTVFLGCLCVIPINIAVIALSTTRLNNFTKLRQDLFGPAT